MLFPCGPSGNRDFARCVSAPCSSSRTGALIFGFKIAGRGILSDMVGPETALRQTSSGSGKAKKALGSPSPKQWGIPSLIPLKDVSSCVVKPFGGCFVLGASWPKRKGLLADWVTMRCWAREARSDWQWGPWRGQIQCGDRI